MSVFILMGEGVHFLNVSLVVFGYILGFWVIEPVGPDAPGSIRGEGLTLVAWILD